MKIYKTLDNGIKIIEYEERYAASLADMWNRSRDNWGGGSELDTEQKQLEIYRKGSYFNVYLALAGEEVIGLCSLSRYYKDADATYLHVLNVRPDYMSQKVGKAMVLLSLERTFELGYPRLEIHTWPGNTNAVPLYKKCGFMWEDNPETTHLTNFLPTILAQELLKPYFADADWYADSTRSLDIKPDGTSSKGFEHFTYTWKKNDGQRLAVTVEKFGRRISRVETDDFIIELTAENHALAYGFDYHAEITTVNKSGRPLSVSVSGKSDGVITFTHDKKSFSVDKPQSKQDPSRKHPCVLADVTVNGMALEMGVGIEVKPPLTARFDAQCGHVVTGRRYDAYITLESALLTEAKVELTLPENDYLEFDTAAHTINIGTSVAGPTHPKTRSAAPSPSERATAQGMTARACIAMIAEVLKAGHVKLDIPCTITLADGQQKTFQMPLDIVNLSLTGCFPCMTESSYGIVNGPFKLETHKTSNNTQLYHTLVDNMHPSEEYPLFLVSKLGKPYDDEFNIAEPIGTNAYQTGADMIMELSYLSEKQPGIVMTMIYTLSAAGIVTRKHRIQNTGGSDKTLFLSETIFTCISPSAAFCYDGRITLSRNAAGNGFGSADITLLEENWAFENEPDFTIGVCWDPSLKPSFRYDDGIVLEHELELAGGGTAETPPVTVCLGVFRDYSAFRAYAMQIYSPYVEPAEDLLEMTVNGGNPFVHSGDFTVSIRNNRNQKHDGSIEISPKNSSFFEPQSSICQGDASLINPIADVLIKPNMAKTHSKQGIIKAKTSFPTYMAEMTRAVFFSNGGIECTNINGILTISNGCLTFKSDPGHHPGLYSLKSGSGAEWLLSRHPKLEPYGWWNPFVGGMRNWLEKIDTANTLKENISACFTEMEDSHGNLWQGICARVDISQNKDYKGLTYESYYLTLPGVPVLCSFTRYINNTGGYLSTATDEGVYYQSGKLGEESVAEVMHRGKTIHIIPGNGDSSFHTYKAEFVRITTDGGEKLHWLPNFADRRAWGSVHNDIHCFGCYRDFIIKLKNGGEMLTRPMFLIFGDCDLTKEELSALERLTFE